MSEEALEQSEGPSPGQEEQARKRQKFRRNAQTLKRMLSHPSPNGTWGRSQHRGTAKRWH